MVFPNVCTIIAQIGRYVCKTEKFLINQCYDLTLSRLEIFLTRVVWTFGNLFINNFGINHNFTKCLNEGCWFDFGPNLSFKYFLNNVFTKF